MTTTIDYALLAGASYISTRPDANKFPLPQGWNQISYSPPVSSGFEAAAFQNGNEIVISFAGTYDKSPADYAADVLLAEGYGATQLLEAAAYYLSIKNDPRYQGCNITLTGHSLGGGLASLVSVFFHVSATTFDQAPFANSAQSNSLLSNPLNILTPDVAANLKTDLLAMGYSEADLSALSNFLLIRPTDGSIPNSNLVTNINVQGEFLSAAPATLFDRIGTTTDEILNSSTGVSGFDLHSQALLSAFLQSNQTAITTPEGQKQSLSQVTFKLTDLLKMVFDKNLFANDTDTDKRNILEHLVRHQAGGVGGVSAGGDAMVTRITTDLWKLAQDGGLTMSDLNGQPNNFNTWNNVSKALTAFAMQKYYDEKTGSIGLGATLFQDVSGGGGIQFDTAAVAGAGNSITGAKGHQYFQNYLDTTSTLTLPERTLIKSILPTLRDWYVQAGSSGMNATDTLNRGAFMLGGNGADTLTGGTAADLLVGNAGADTLQGRGGNDTLLGGAGNDTYQYNAGDGLDTILDSDGQGSIVVDTTTLSGGDQYGDSRVHKDANGHLYVDAGQGNLIIDGNILIQNYSAGGTFGLTMNGAAPETAPQATLAGTGNDDDIDLGATNTANDVIDAGAGQDYVFAGYGNDVIIGGTGSDALDGFAGNDRIYADNFIGVADAIAQGDAQTGTGMQGDALSGDGGDDTLIGGNGDDILSAGAGADLLVAGAGDDYVFGDTDWAAGNGRNWGVVNGGLVGGAGGLANWSGDNTDVIYAGAGDDRVWGELGNDVIFGEKGADLLVGGDGNDVILGGDNSDTIYGDGDSIAAAPGNDYLDGGAGSDTIYGNEGGDIILGGKDNDTLYTEGNDIIVYNLGDGDDRVRRVDTGSTLTYRFGSGIDPNTFKLREGSLLLDFGNGDAIHIMDFNQQDVFNSLGESRFEFADGTVLDGQQVLARGFDLDGTAGDDQMRWRTSAATISNRTAVNDETAHVWRVAA